EHARTQFLQQLDNFAFNRALEIAWSIVARMDKMITDAKPWEVAKDENQTQTLDAVLYRAAQSLRWLSVMLYPVMPQSAAQMWTHLGLQGSPGAVNPLELKWGGLEPGITITEVKALFPRIDKAKLLSEIGSPAAHRHR